jgi:hypothetical protein
MVNILGIMSIFQTYFLVYLLLLGKFNKFNERKYTLKNKTNLRYLFRLYWFPLKILYTTSVVSVYVAAERGAGLYLFLNSLLWLLLGLDIYWFCVSFQIIILKINLGQFKIF